MRSQASNDRQLIPGAVSKAVSRKNRSKRNQSASGESTLASELSDESRNVMVNIEALQTVAIAHLRRDHPLRRLLLAERTLLKPEEYIAKLESWQVLLRES